MLIPFANPLQPLIDVLEQVLLFFHDTIGVGWGLAIILLTVSVRLVLLPLTLKQVTSMQRLQLLAPEMKAIQQKYKEDKQRQQQEMMKFYRENRVNPLASCLPLLFQLPFFIALYFMLRTDLKADMCPGVEGYARSLDTSVTHVTCTQFGDSQYAAAHNIHVADPSFLFIPDLTAKATGAVLVVLIVLYVGSQLASTLLMSTTTDRTQRMIFAALPFFFVLFIIRFPAGLLVYWITTNLWTIVQQLIIRRRLGPIRPPGQEGMGSLGDLLRGGRTPATSPALPSGAGSGSGGRSGGRDGKAPEGRPTGPPPAPPRRKKKRSGRRR
jgi:YidC/Oxa1 family membrane protein insertase